MATCAALLVLATATSSCDPVHRRAPASDDRPAHVSFLSRPDGASIRLNGTLLEGTTPIEYYPVPVGLSVVDFEKEGYLPVRAEHTWGPGAVARLDMHLVPEPTPTSRPTLRERTPRATAVPAAVPVPTTTPRKTRSPKRTVAPTPVPTAVVPKTTTVDLISTPPGASVTVNGEALQGVTPLKRVVLPPGKAVIEFRLADYEPAAVDRTWEPGGEDSVAVELVGLPARVSIETTPSGATVKVNGVIIEGQTPIEGALVPAGTTQVVIELENYFPHVEHRTLEANSETRFEAELTPLNTAVRFESDPPGATILVNNKALPETSPAGPLSMPPGHARIEFQLPGHAARVIERDWAPNGLDSVMAKLTPNPGRAQFESPDAWEALAVDGKAVAIRPGSWLPLMAGPHRALAQREGRAAETDFVVPPGGDVVVTLNWSNKRPAAADFVELPAITARLGDERFADSNPPREVDVAAFWMARREVTVDEYRACVEASRCPEPGTGEACTWNAPDRGKHPINCVSATDAEAYAAWLADVEKISYRLPTIDEWERAARGRDGRHYPWGDEPVGPRCNTCDRACGIERFRDESFNDGRPETAPVGVLAYCASSEGIVDLVGNVAEWTRVSPDGTYQVRGGSWAQNGVFLEPALAVARTPADRDPTIGFRLAVSSDSLPQTPAPASTATPADTPTPDAAPLADAPTTGEPIRLDTPPQPELPKEAEPEGAT